MISEVRRDPCDFEIFYGLNQKFLLSCTKLQNPVCAISLNPRKAIFLFQKVKDQS